MQMKERVVPHAIILDVVGDLTYANRTAFKSAVEKAKQAGCRHLIVNLEHVRFVDSAGLDCSCSCRRTLNCSRFRSVC